MKKVLVLIALALLIPTCLAFVPTMQDSEWARSAIDNVQIVATDFSLIGSAVESSDFTGVKKYCGYAKTDVSNALGESKSYTVSYELRKAKNYYEQGLNEYYLGAALTMNGIDEMDPSKIKEAITHMQSGVRYFQLTTKEINDLIGA